MRVLRAESTRIRYGYAPIDYADLYEHIHTQGVYYARYTRTLSAQIELDSIRADPPRWADCGHARIHI